MSLRDLALVIPVRDDHAGLARLLDQARDMGCFDQIIVVDDASSWAITVPEKETVPAVELIRQETGQGGGVARNRGLEEVRTSHMLFFDADDLLTDALPHLLADLRRAEAFDFCLFKHVDSRVAAAGLWGQPGWDEDFWRAAKCGTAALMPATPAMRAHLVQTANYPWNKVYRTAFLRDNGIGCAATSVHQDIPLHWLGFLAAERVLVSARVCAWHGVSRAGGRLTNRTGPERFEVFTALAPVVTALEAREPTWRVPFVTFVLGLVDWVAGRIAREHLAALREAEAEFLMAGPGRWQDEIARTDPGLAQRLRTRQNTSLASVGAMQ